MILMNYIIIKCFWRFYIRKTFLISEKIGTKLFLTGILIYEVVTTVFQAHVANANMLTQKEHLSIPTIL